MSVIGSVARAILPKTAQERLSRRISWTKYQSRFNDAIQHFVLEKGVTDPVEINQIRRSLVKAFVKDNWYPEEYFHFHYDLLSRKGIHEFVANREASCFWNYMNTREVYLLTCDKGLTYQKFRPFYHRDLVSISSDNPNSIGSFVDFVSHHSRFIVKPTYGNYGKGVRVVERDEQSIESLFVELINDYPDGFTIEELIIQCAELATFHPSSVNTVRLTTARQTNGDIYIVHRAFIRFGQDGRCVDNAGSGGIIAGIDFETGIINGAIDEQLNRFVVHPNTGKVILGYKVPRWNEAKSFVLELAKVLPDLNYCGWDLALTDNGWVMVEANGKGLFIGFQMPTQEGFREEFEAMKKLCGYIT